MSGAPNNSVPIEKRVRQIVSSFERGILTRPEAGRMLFDLLTVDNLSDVLKLFPELFVDDIKERVRRMPVSPWDWQRSLAIDTFNGSRPIAKFDDKFHFLNERKAYRP